MGRQRKHRRQPQAKFNTPGFPAKFCGTCAVCGARFYPGTPIRRYNGEWAEVDCVDFQRNREHVLSGDTFRAQPRPWKRERRRQ